VGAALRRGDAVSVQPQLRECGRGLARRTGTRYNSGMIETPVLGSPAVWLTESPRDPAPLLKQMATLRQENAAPLRRVGTRL
jgi:hypothetical protein